MRSVYRGASASPPPLVRRSREAPVAVPLHLQVVITEGGVGEAISEAEERLGGGKDIIVARFFRASRITVIAPPGRFMAVVDRHVAYRLGDRRSEEHTSELQSRPH